jgi:elongator complex protein 3
MDPEKWLEARRYKPEHLETARKVLEEVRRGKEVWQVMRHYPLKGGGYLPKHMLVAVYHQLVASGEWAEDNSLLERIRMKPVRTLSGVTTVTVLTKSYPCPGHCIFCPTEERMPKSYLSDEPGARRGLQHGFDPFEQVHSRLTALEAVGHPTDKIELLILGGTFSAYRRDYQEWFVKRCFDALNGVELADLAEAHHYNESALHRNVGLVVETRPDEITAQELAWLRGLGVTKVQMGAQSLDDRILELNKRGHTVEDTLRACALLRAGGFKIVLHWMPNLLGATLESDHVDFIRLWTEARKDQAELAGFCPDEIKIYPCQLLENAELYQYWQRGEFSPYSEKDLVSLVADIKPGIPRYCRVNRVVRDIPSTHVVSGSKRTSLRQDVQEELVRRGTRCQCLRCREVRGQAVALDQLRLDELVYHPALAEEHFLSFVTPEDQVAGYLRLSLPELNLAKVFSEELESGGHPAQSYEGQGFEELEGAAIIREVHVYGQSLQVGAEKAGAAQHAGLGTRLIAAAEQIAREHGFKRMAVIAAVGTRGYYRGRGFAMGNLYMVKKLAD